MRDFLHELSCFYLCSFVIAPHVLIVGSKFLMGIVTCESLEK